MLKKVFKEHRNLSLFVILVIALAATYIFEEKRNRDNELLEAKKNAIIDTSTFGELVSFKGLKIDIEKKGDKYFAKDNHLLLSQPKMDEFFKILGGLKIKKTLSDEEIKNVDRSFYIPNSDLALSFQFKNGDLKFALGKKLEYDQSFYMEVIRGNQRKIMVVTDESPDPNIYQNESEYKRSEFKFQRLQMLFYLTNVFFYDTRVFAQFNYDEKRINFKTIDIATFRNRKFTVDFEKTKTNPPIQEGIDYFEENWISFHRVLSTLEGKTMYFPYAKANLTEPLSIFDVVDRDGKKYTLEVYKKYGSLPGYFLKTSFNEYLYELRGEEAKYFFVNVQDFWKKNIFPNQKEFNLDIQFPKETATNYKVEIKDKEIFTGSAAGHKIKLAEFKKLIDFLKTESDHISEMNEKPSDLVGKAVMKLYFANRNIGVILEENEVLVVDFDHKFKMHYYTGIDIPFSTRSIDYFEK